MKNEINEIILELAINCPRDKAWNTMLNKMSDWWPSDFVALPGSKGIKFEPWAGGRLYEQTDEGAHLLWGTAVNIQPNEVLEIVGFVVPAFGGPSINFCKMELADLPAGTTKFKLTNTILGHLSEESRESTQEGWNYLYMAFKEFCEKN